LEAGWALALEHPGNAHCIVGLPSLVQVTGSGKLFRDLAQRPPHTSDRIGATQPL